MLNPKKRLNSLGSQTMPFESGLTKEKSNISQPKVDIEDICWKNLKKQDKNPRDGKSSTLVFHLENNKEISITNSDTYKKNIQDTPLSPILDQGSTMKDLDSRGFWKGCSREISKWLWLPTEIGLQGLDMDYLNGFSNNTTPHSFVIQNPVVQKNKNYQRTSWQSLLSSQLDTMEKENIPEKILEQQYCRKIRIYPSTTHKKYFESMFGATRYLQNRIIAALSAKEITISDCANHYKLRNFLSYRDRELEDKNSWLKETPYDTRDLAVSQFSSNMKTIFTLLKTGKIDHFNLQFRSKKNNKKTCFLPANVIKSLTAKQQKEENKQENNKKKYRLFPRRIKDEFVEFSEDLEALGKYGQITLTRECGKYYMCFPLKRPIKSTSIKSPKTVALDPGVKTFQTFYSDSGCCGKIGDKVSDSIEKNYYRKIDSLKSVLDTNEELSGKTRGNIKKRCSLLRNKVKNTVIDLHRKTCSWLTSNFQLILLPVFNVKDMVSTEKSLHPKTRRKMLCLSHYSFKQRLLHMAESRNCTVKICNESYTSKTCGSCGYINDSLKSQRVFHCPNESCGFVIDRDYNGARNICLKYAQNQGSIAPFRIGQ